MYYVGRNGSQSGPHPLDELKKMATFGQLAPVDLVWTDGMSEWKPAGVALPDLFQAAPSAAPASPVPEAPFPPAVPPPPADQPILMSGAPIPTYLWQSIVVTLICCMPPGIPAIVFASQVESKRQNGDIAGAMASSKNAKLWCLIGLGLGLLWYLCIVAYVVVVIVVASNEHRY